MVCIFDCETIPDTTLIRKIFNIDEPKSYELIKRAQEEYSKSHNGSTFLPLPYHKVVTISAVIAKNSGEFIKVGDFGKGSEVEEDIIRHFFEFIEEKNPKLVSFNGRGFDMPMLLIRAMKYNISFPTWFEESNPNIKKSKWENYRQRYSEEFHTDLLDSLGGFGAIRNLKLDLLCSMADIPGKYDVSGEQVVDLYYSGELDKIREYCQSDVLNTYWLWLKYELLKGSITLGGYKEALRSMKKKLPKDMGYYLVFESAIKRELETKTL